MSRILRLWYRFFHREILLLSPKSWVYREVPYIFYCSNYISWLLRSNLWIPVRKRRTSYFITRKDMIIDTWRDIPTLLVSPFWEDRMMASYALAKETSKTAYAFLSREWVPASNDTLFPSKAMQLATAEGLFHQWRLNEEQLRERLYQIELSHKYTK